MGFNDGPSRTRTWMLHAALTAHEDARLQAPGLRRNDSRQQWTEGNGLAPLGWEPWDYEQGQGYTGVYVGVGQTPWPYGPDDLDLDEAGVHPWDLSDEMEDWDLGPARKRYSHDEDLDCHRREPALDPSLWVDPEQDERARRYERQRMKDAEKAERRAAQDEQYEYVKMIRRNQDAMRHAAIRQIEAKAVSGEEGTFAVQVRKGNQFYRVDYRVEDGKAYITKRHQGWVPKDQQR